MKNAPAIIVIFLIALAAAYLINYYTQTPSTPTAAPQPTPAPIAAPTTIATPVQQPLNVGISFIEVPASAEPNAKVIVAWKVDSDAKKDIEHTGVHYGSKSIPGDLSDVAPADSGYPELTAISDTVIPNEFSIPLFIQDKGTIYLRAHVAVDDKNYWTEERTITVG
ncbi:MAG: hypothetical protein HY361_02680 [Candidatus Aenigmarchaeota archaeon]|nr:hypothetical protein [Candidatus Aenigmarchaeota archaeon]